MMRFLDRLLLLVIPAFRANEIIGDLRERARERTAAGDGALIVTVWYVRNTASLVLYYALARLRRRPNPRTRRRQAIKAQLMRTLFDDTRIAVRSLVRRPSFSLVVIGTLMLGVGANTAIFTVVRNLVLRPLPYPESDRLVELWMEFRHQPGAPGFEIVASEPEYLEFLDATTSFQSIAALWTSEMNLTGGVEPIRVASAAVSANFFDVVQVAPSVGRGFAVGEDRPGAGAVAVITDGLWTRAFGRDPSLIGQAVMADGRPYQVVGVLPATFRFPGGDVDLLRPNIIDPSNPAGRSSHYLRLLGRLAPEVTVDAAQVESTLLNARLGLERPAAHGLSEQHPMVLASLQQRITGPIRPALWVLSGAAALVLLIACANVANLMYARSESRTRELMIRQAIGAGRARLITHLLTESVVLGLVGAGAGLFLSTVTVPLLTGAAGDHLPAFARLEVDWMILAFTGVLAMISALVFGLAPAFNSTARTRAALRDRAIGLERGRTRIRNALLLSQVAVAVVLLVGAGVLLRNLVAMLRIDPGFNPDGVVTMSFSLDRSRYESPASLVAFHRLLNERLTSRPGIVAAGAIRALPLATDGGFETVTVTGASVPEGESVNAIYQIASPGYFRALSVPLLEGRLFDDSDGSGAAPVVVINRTMARRYWPDGEAIGNTIQLGMFEDNPNPAMTIIGIVGDIKHRGLAREATPQMFAPRAQAAANYQGLGTRPATLVVKGTDPPPSLIAQVQSVFHDLDPDIPLSNIGTMHAVVTRSVADERFMSLLLTIFAGVALALAAIGVYGVTAYLVVQRTPEIGVRMALGANRRLVIGYVVRRSMILAIIGAGIGLLAAVAGSRLLEGFVSLGDVRDPWVYVLGPGLLFATALLAALGPARRAAGIDPLTAIRME